MRAFKRVSMALESRIVRGCNVSRAESSKNPLFPVQMSRASLPALLAPARLHFSLLLVLSSH
jgi:hypothetical protein